MTKCPRCSSTDIEIDRPSCTCRRCNYVGPIKNPNHRGDYLAHHAHNAEQQEGDE